MAGISSGRLEMEGLNGYLSSWRPGKSKPGRGEGRSESGQMGERVGCVGVLGGAWSTRANVEGDVPVPCVLHSPRALAQW